MARGRSDKGKKMPLDKPVEKKPKMMTVQSDERISTNAEPSGRVMGETSAQHPSLQSTAQPTIKPDRSKKRPERQPSVDSREPETFSEQTVSAPNGHEDIEEDPATHGRIAERAYKLFQESGYEHGNDWSHWFEAERQIKETRV